MLRNHIRHNYTNDKTRKKKVFNDANHNNALMMSILYGMVKFVTNISNRIM